MFNEKSTDEYYSIEIKNEGSAHVICKETISVLKNYNLKIHNLQKRADRNGLAFRLNNLVLKKSYCRVPLRHKS